MLASLTPLPFMPVRGERVAPSFDPSRPSELGRYFAQLELLFSRCSIVSDSERKFFSTSYLDYDLADAWEAVPEYSDADATYSAFRNTILAFYNQSILRFTPSDLEDLVQKNTNISTLSDLTTFHLSFCPISKTLLDANLISLADQQRAYASVFSEQVQSSISRRLHIKHPDHHPTHPYSVDQLYDAAKWSLQSFPLASPLFLVESPSPSISSVPTPLPIVQPSQPDSSFATFEDINVLFSKLAQTVVQAVASSPPSLPPTSSRQSSSPRPVEVPSSVPSVSLSTSTSQPPIASTFQLSRLERIRQIEEELSHLKSTSDTAFSAQNCVQKTTARPDTSIVDSTTLPSNPPPSTSTIKSPASPSTPSRSPRPVAARSYAPPQEPNFGSPIKKPQVSKKLASPSPSSRSLPPIYKPAIVPQDHDRLLDSKLDISARNLAAVAPAIRSNTQEDPTPPCPSSAASISKCPAYFLDQDQLTEEDFKYIIPDDVPLAQNPVPVSVFCAAIRSSTPASAPRSLAASPRYFAPSSRRPLVSRPAVCYPFASTSAHCRIDFHSFRRHHRPRLRPR